MIVYVYDKKTNEKVETIKDVFRVSANKDNFVVHNNGETINIPKKGIKLVVYGF